MGSLLAVERWADWSSLAVGGVRAWSGPGGPSVNGVAV